MTFVPAENRYMWLKQVEALCKSPSYQIRRRTGNRDLWNGFFYAPSITAWAAASLAIGTLYGEQLT